MKIRVEEIKESEKETSFVEEVTEINEALARNGLVDYQLRHPVPVALRYYRLGADLMFHGSFTGAVSGTCARCLEAYPFSVERDFTYVLKPSADGPARDQLAEEDLSLSSYRGNEVDISPLVREAVILSLPTRPLCSEDCSGLCPRCGVNRNTTTCSCHDEWIDPR
ncbi:MAG: YceD family protein, partial [Candidatus Binatia bacterium]